MIKIDNVAPADIERESFATITRELGDKQPSPELAPIVKRVIHTTADFEYADTLYFSPDVVEICISVTVVNSAVGMVIGEAVGIAKFFC